MNDQYRLACYLLYGTDSLEREFNGTTDNTQVIIWKKDGREIARSEGGKHTYTPEFKQLFLDRINELF